MHELIVAIIGAAAIAAYVVASLKITRRTVTIRNGELHHKVTTIEASARASARTRPKRRAGKRTRQK